jgi:hypothetical protein
MYVYYDTSYNEDAAIRGQNTHMTIRGWSFQELMTCIQIQQNMISLCRHTQIEIIVFSRSVNRNTNREACKHYDLDRTGIVKHHLQLLQLKRKKKL